MNQTITHELAWIVLRVIYGWIFLWPIPMLLKDWDATKEFVGILFPKNREFFAGFMIIAMPLAAICIIIGFWGQIGGALLAIISLMGVRVHFQLAKGSKLLKLSDSASSKDVIQFDNVRLLSAMGHIGSAQKNIVLMAVGIFFMLQGTGPLSAHQPSIGLLQLLVMH